MKACLNNSRVKITNPKFFKCFNVLGELLRNLTERARQETTEKSASLLNSKLSINIFSEVKSSSGQKRHSFLIS